MPDGRRLTAERVAGFALGEAFKLSHAGRLWALGLNPISTVEIQRVASGRPETPKRSMTCVVADVHQRTVAKAAEDVCARLHAAGYAIVGCVVPQRGATQHDLVLERRSSDDGRCRGQYSGELKLRTAPANRPATRKDCHGLFTVACRESTTWLGQVIIVVEISAEGDFFFAQ